VSARRKNATPAAEGKLQMSTNKGRDKNKTSREDDPLGKRKAEIAAKIGGGLVNSGKRRGPWDSLRDSTRRSLLKSVE